MAIIRMRDHLYDEIVNYAKEHLPEEACGLLAGRPDLSGKSRAELTKSRSDLSKQPGSSASFAMLLDKRTGPPRWSCSF